MTAQPQTINKTTSKDPFDFDFDSNHSTGVKKSTQSKPLNFNKPIQNNKPNMLDDFTALGNKSEDPFGFSSQPQKSTTNNDPFDFSNYSSGNTKNSSTNKSSSKGGLNLDKLNEICQPPSDGGNNYGYGKTNDNMNFGVSSKNTQNQNIAGYSNQHDDLDFLRGGYNQGKKAQSGNSFPDNNLNFGGFGSSNSQNKPEPKKQVGNKGKKNDLEDLLNF